MKLLTRETTTIETVNFINVNDRYDALPPGRFAIMSMHRADRFISAGLARMPKVVPADAVVATFTEAAFLPRPAPAEPDVLTREQICERFKWLPEQFEAAVLCGFPAASLTSHVVTNTGEGRVLQRWHKDHVDAWRARVSSLCLG